MKTKNIGYAYASSDIAKSMGYAKTGCWFVAVYDDTKPIKMRDVIMASDKRESIENCAQSFTEPYGKYSFKFVEGSL